MPNNEDYSRRESQSKGNNKCYVGAAHTSGGHTFCDGQRIHPEGGILKINNGSIVVKGGTKWIDILSVGSVPCSMQSYNNFSVAGSISANAHGPFYECKPVGQIVNWMKVDGQVLTPEDELFWHVVGGYGCQGDIQEAEVQTIPDTNLKEYRILIPTDMLTAVDRPSLTFSGHLAPDWNTAYMTYGFSEPGEVAAYKDPSHWVARTVFQLPPKIRWALERGVGPFLDAPLSQRFINTKWFEPGFFLKKFRYSWLLEFFIPRDKAVHWMEEAKDMLPPGILNTTIRDVAADPNPILTYSPKRSFGFVMYGTTGHDESELKSATRDLIDLTIGYEGKYYLPYRPHALREQFQECYPRFQELKVKDGISNRFFQRYLNKD